jgi:hypothetical protein
MECNIPTAKARARTAFPRDVPRAAGERSEVEWGRPEGHPEEKLFLPKLGVVVKHSNSR